MKTIPDDILNILRKKFAGEIFIEQSHRLQYATDASAYREIPLMVTRPKDSRTKPSVRRRVELEETSESSRNFMKDPFACVSNAQCLDCSTSSYQISATFGSLGNTQNCVDR